jgi:hypothetical protein
MEATFILEVSHDSQVILTSYFSGNQTEVTSLQTDLKILGKDKANYSISSKDEHFQLVVYNIINEPIFKSKSYFKTKENAEKEIERLVQLFETDVNNFLFRSKKSTEELKFPNDFNYSNHINLIMPDWPLRFQNKDFREFIERSIQDYIPAHLSFSLFYLEVKQMHRFEKTYQEWIELKVNNNKSEVAKLSLQLIQLLKSYR